MVDKHECCCGAKGQSPQLDEILARYLGVDGALIPVLQEVQQLYGYLSKDVVEYVAERLMIPVSQIYGVITFYSQFHLNPRGRNIIRVCQGTACHVRGGGAILKALEEKLQIVAGETTPDMKYTLETVACIGACGLAPVMMINEDTHGRLTPETVPDILAQYS